jgi:hypothetical protein
MLKLKAGIAYYALPQWMDRSVLLFALVGRSVILFATMGSQILFCALMGSITMGRSMSSTTMGRSMMLFCTSVGFSSTMQWAPVTAPPQWVDCYYFVLPQRVDCYCSVIPPYTVTV